MPLANTYFSVSYLYGILCYFYLFFQIDLLENPAIDDVVVLSVVLDEVKNKSLAVYNRLRALCGNPLRKFFVFSNEHHKYVVQFHLL